LATETLNVDDLKDGTAFNEKSMGGYTTDGFYYNITQSMLGYNYTANGTEEFVQSYDVSVATIQKVESDFWLYDV